MIEIPEILSDHGARNSPPQHLKQTRLRVRWVWIQRWILLWITLWIDGLVLSITKEIRGTLAHPSNHQLASASESVYEHVSRETLLSLCTALLLLGKSRDLLDFGTYHEFNMGGLLLRVVGRGIAAESPATAQRNDYSATPHSSIFRLGICLWISMWITFGDNFEVGGLPTAGNRRGEAASPFLISRNRSADDVLT